MNMKLNIRKEHGHIVAASVLILVLGPILAYVAASVLAEVKAKRVRSAWGTTLGPREDFRRRFPRRGSNEAARALETASATLGLDLAPRTLAGRVHPTAKAAERFQRIKPELVRFIEAQLERPTREIDPPLEPLASFLQDHAEALSIVRRLLIEGAIPRWELDAEKIDGPIPNLLGHLHLHKLLIADVLVRARDGQQEAARAGLEASWRLNLALRDDPILITQLVASGVTRLQAGALRKVDAVPDSWRARLRQLDYRSSIMTALQLEGWMWTMIADLDQVPGPRTWGEVGRFLGRPYVRFCLADASERYRRALARRAAEPIRCGEGAHDAQRQLAFPRWNWIGKRMFANVIESLARVDRLRLDLELTDKILGLETARRSTAGAWPATVAGIESSSACPTDHWRYEVQDGVMTLSLSRQPDWTGQLGAILPVRFSSTQNE